MLVLSSLLASTDDGSRRRLTTLRRSDGDVGLVAEDVVRVCEFR